MLVQRKTSFVCVEITSQNGEENVVYKRKNYDVDDESEYDDQERGN
jgi:hypothetical protein